MSKCSVNHAATEVKKIPVCCTTEGLLKMWRDWGGDNSSGLTTTQVTRKEGAAEAAGKNEVAGKKIK